MFLKLLKKTDTRTVRISALFDRSMLNTTIAYEAAAMFDLKGDRASHEVITANGKRETSHARYSMPLLHVGGHTRLVKASGVMRTARIRTGGKSG